MLKKVKLDKAVGLVIGHDMTKVVPGKFKGPAFRRGHIIRQEDLPELRLMGKEHIYVIEEEEGLVHENTICQPETIVAATKIVPRL